MGYNEPTRRAFMTGMTIMLVLMIFAMLGPKCQNPDDLKPPEDSLIPPPDPPTPLAPENGYVYMFEDPPFNIVTIFEWTPIDDADFYEIRYTIDTFPPVSITSKAPVCTMFTKDTTHRRCMHYWRVRAEAQIWEWFTEWSIQRWFEMRQRPFGPHLQYPPNGAIFTIDTFPYLMEMQWDSVSDEEFYEILVHMDTILYEQTIVYQNNFSLNIGEYASYYWQVRAGSRKWQFYSLWSEQRHFRIIP